MHFLPEWVLAPVPLKLPVVLVFRPRLGLVVQRRPGAVLALNRGQLSVKFVGRWFGKIISGLFSNN